MLAENLFEKIGFTDEMSKEYEKYKNLINDKFEVMAEETVLNYLQYPAHELNLNRSEYTADQIRSEARRIVLGRYKGT